MADLIKRLWTAIVLVPILVIALFVDPTPWSILALAVLFGGFALDEYLRMALPQRSLSGPAATSGPSTACAPSWGSSARPWSRCRWCSAPAGCCRRCSCSR
ncbi:hypothetical protein [Nannocystis pusilla]|uniref:hypothetical protein n=1 Tax=Nannocystis pusilla TaxID=889268 RepID=UPI003B7F576C